MDTSFPAAVSSCPCCSFIGRDLFLPLSYEDESKPRNSNTVSKVIALKTDVISPTDAWKIIVSKSSNRHGVLLVDTHGHPHLQRDFQYAHGTSFTDPAMIEKVVSLTCSVSHLDWADTLKYASKSKLILPAIGVHPWYLADILIKKDQTEEIENYLQWNWLIELESHLSQHPNLIVGEIGLCKMAKFVRDFPKELGGKTTALQLQMLVFRKQMDLAAKWSRPVTVHCVNMHGTFMDVLKEILQHAKESYKRNDNATDEENSMQRQTHVRASFPPSIAMHSFTGTAHHMQEILLFEEEIMNPDQAPKTKHNSGKLKIKKNDNSFAEKQSKTSSSNSSRLPRLFYFGFSHAVNHIMCTSDKANRKGMEAVRAVPCDRLLAESDVHATADVVLGTAGAVAYIASARGEELSDVAEQTTMNGLRYLSPLSLTSQLTMQQDHPLQAVNKTLSK